MTPQNFSSMGKTGGASRSAAKAAAARKNGALGGRPGERYHIRVSIRSVDGARFAAQVTVLDTWLGERQEHDCHTNSAGDGLWVDGQQVDGTCQFSVRTVAAWRAALRRWFKED